MDAEDDIQRAEGGVRHAEAENHSRFRRDEDFRANQRQDRQRKGGVDPADLLLTDRPLLVCVTLWAASVVLIIYHPF